MRAKNHINLINNTVRKKKIKILELGPGKGYFAQAVIQQGWEYIAVDGSELITERLINKGIKVYQSMMPPIPDSIDKDFDVIFVEHLLEHMDSSHMALELISSAYDKLKPGGTIIIICPDMHVFGIDFYNCDYTHQYPTTHKRIIQILFDANFKTIYRGFEILNIRSSIITFLLSWSVKILFFSGLPFVVGKLTGLYDRFEKIKLDFLRSIVLIGEK